MRRKRLQHGPLCKNVKRNLKKAANSESWDLLQDVALKQRQKDESEKSLTNEIQSRLV